LISEFEIYPLNQQIR